MGLNKIPRSWQRGFEIAKVVSLLSNANKTSKKMGAALFNQRTPISVGFNVYDKTHPDYVDSDINGEAFCRNTHAEFMALTKRKHYDNTSNLIMYIYRETANGFPANSNPCSFCREQMKSFGVKKIRYIDEYTNYREERL